jgi:hypothetical protein
MKELIKRKEGEYASDGVLAAKNIRIELKEAFPNIKFSVRKEHYGCVNVEWTNGPTVAAVDAIIHKYEEGSFDGMTDMYEYNNSEWPANYGGSKYIFSRRNITDDIRENVKKRLSSEYGIDMNNLDEAFNTFHCWPDQKINMVLRDMTL